MELSGAAEAEGDVHGDALSPELGPSCSESPIVHRRDRLGSTGARDSPPGGSVRSGSQISGDSFGELSRIPAMRIVTAVTRPTIVASPG